MAKGNHGFILNKALNNRKVLTLLTTIMGIIMKNISCYLTYLLIFFSCLLLFVLFTRPSVYINRQLVIQAEDAVKLQCKDQRPISNEMLKEGLKIELNKANTEIQAKLDHEFEWIRLKYYVVGALFLGFWSRAFLKNGSSSDEDKGVLDKFKSYIASTATSFILALTALIGITVDMQILSARIVMEQLGHWIYLYAEPIFLAYDSTDDAKNVGWEKFLKLQGGFQNSIENSLMFWPNIFFLSILLYAFYLLSSTLAVKNHIHNPQNTNDTTLLWIGFWLLHITLLFFTFSNHIIPSIFSFSSIQISLGWFGLYTIDSEDQLKFYLFVWLLLTFFSFIAIRLSGRKSINNATNKGGGQLYNS